MSPKEYLQQAYRIERRVNLDKEMLESMRSALHGRSVNYESDGSQRNPQGNSIERAILRVVEYEERINTEIEELTQKRLEIEEVIEAVPDETLREILKRRYLMYQKWDKIAEEMHYSIQWIHKLHGAALTKIKTGD